MSRRARLALLYVWILGLGISGSAWAQESGPPTAVPQATPSASLSPVFVSPSPPAALPMAVPDQASTAQLREAFRQVPGLHTITLEVRGGVAVLRDEVSSFQQSLQAAELAQKVEGLIAGIPNATVFKAIILNYTRNPQRRFTFAVSPWASTRNRTYLTLRI